MNDILGHKAEYILECINKINSLGHRKLHFGLLQATKLNDILPLQII